jgi:hypothetical protein
MHHICVDRQAFQDWESCLEEAGVSRIRLKMKHTGQPRDRWPQHDPWKLPVFAVWVGGCFKCFVDLDLWNKNRTNIKAYKSSLEDDKIVVNLFASEFYVYHNFRGPRLVKSLHFRLVKPQRVAPQRTNSWGSSVFGPGENTLERRWDLVSWRFLKLEFRKAWNLEFCCYGDPGHYWKWFGICLPSFRMLEFNDRVVKVGMFLFGVSWPHVGVA